MPEPPPPDPRGIKRPCQQFKVYYAATTNPAAPGTWTLAPEVKFESLQGNSGAAPNVCILIENKAPTEEDGYKRQGSPAAFGTGKTGTGATGTLFKGAHLDVDSLVKVEANTVLDPSTFIPIFIGVVVKSGLDLDGEFTTWTCEDYRHFMRKAVVYGRTVYDPYIASPYSVYIRGFRTTFNEGGEPDRYQEGVALGGPEVGRCLPVWLPPGYNRADYTIPGPAHENDAIWADYWLAGHAWEYLRTTYFSSAPSDIAHLDMSAFINMPQAVEWAESYEETDLHWLYEYDFGGTMQRVIVSDLAVTGVDLARIIGLLLQAAGTYDWTLVPNADGNKSDIVPFNVHEGNGVLDYTWGDYGQTVAGAEPDVTGGKVTRDQTEYYNRGYAISRKKIVETTLTTIAEQFAEGAPASLVMDAAAGDVTGYLAAVAANSPDAKKDLYYQDVYRRYSVPPGYDWGTYIFNSGKVRVGVKPAFRHLLTTGAASQGTFDDAKEYRNLQTMVWRSKDGGDTWEAKPDSIAVERMGNTSIRLGANARTGQDPWTWNGDTTTPVVYDIMVTLALEMDEPLDTSVNNAGSERAREFFLDGGNRYRQAARVYAVVPVDGSGNITCNTPSTTSTKGTKAAPDIFIGEGTSLTAELKYRMLIKNATNISGSLVLTGLRIDPWPIGCLVGELTVDAEDPKRESMQLNACVRSFRMDRAGDTTTYTLDGR